jgi:hypothetical protein
MDALKFHSILPVIIIALLTLKKKQEISLYVIGKIVRIERVVNQIQIHAEMMVQDVTGIHKSQKEMVIIALFHVVVRNGITQMKIRNAFLYHVIYEFHLIMI